MAVTSSVNTPSYTATSWLHLTHIDKDLHSSAGQVGSVLQGVRMTGSIAPNRPGHQGTVVARTVGTVAISCNVTFVFRRNVDVCDLKCYICPIPIITIFQISIRSP